MHFTIIYIPLVYIAPCHSSATRVQMENFTVIFLNATQTVHLLVKKGLQTFDADTGNPVVLVAKVSFARNIGDEAVVTRDWMDLSRSTSVLRRIEI